MIRFFLDRPVMANVLALMMMLTGGIALWALAIAQYPPVTPPVVQVVAKYPGANALTLQNQVAFPIEQQINGVEDMIYMKSTAANDGTYTLNVSFAVGTDGDQAQVLVQNRLQAALPQLPDAVQQQGVTVRKRSTSMLQIYTLRADDPNKGTLWLSRYATNHIRDALLRVPGVGDVTVFGTGDYSVRVWLDMQRMKQYGLVPADVINAIKSQNRDVSVGQLGSPPQAEQQAMQLTLSVNGRLTDASQFDAMVVKSSNRDGGRLVRLRDVGYAEAGSSNYAQFFNYNGQSAVGIAVSQLPDANALEVGQGVSAAMAQMAQQLPSGVTVALPFDATGFIKDSIHEVWFTLAFSALLVMVVIVVFLQDWRAVMVPATTLPVTLLGAFAFIYMMGFSLNLLTLFAMVLAIGIVVDDAIVVVEGVAQHLEKGLSPRDATLAAMKQLLSPIIAITLVLCAIFLPAAFLSGISGEMYRQFALVIVATTVLSAINAVTLKPVQSALWLRARDPEQRNRFSRLFDRYYQCLDQGYTRLSQWLLKRYRWTFAVGLLLVAASVALFIRLPGGFLPLEDQGYLLVSVRLGDAAALGQTQKTMQTVEKKLSALPYVEDVVTLGGMSALDNNASLSSSALAYVTLKPWSERKGQTLPELYYGVNQALAAVPDSQILVLIPPPIQGIGNGGGVQFMLSETDGGQDYPRLQQVTDAFIQRAKQDPAVANLISSLRADVPQRKLQVDRERAQAMGVSPGDIFDVLQQYLGASYVNQITQQNHSVRIYVQARADNRRLPEDISGLAVKNQAGEMVPLSTLVTLREVRGPAIATLYNLYPSTAVNGMPAAGYSSGQVMSALDKLAQETLPDNIALSWTDMSWQEQLIGHSLYWALGLALLSVGLVLAAQYESFWLPFSVILAVPLAMAGPALLLNILQQSNTLYTQIGLLLLTGLAAKNAILIVEYAHQQTSGGENVIQAALTAAQRRLRPIIMTSLAFIIGALPLLLISGAGGNARKSIGITVFSGMLSSTILMLIFVPCFYVVIYKLETRLRSRRQRNQRTEDYRGRE